MDLGIYNSYMEIDLSAMTRSYYKVKDFIGEGVGIIPVIKGNAYGHGTVELARYYAQSFDTQMIAVSQLIEAVEIRQAGLRDVDLLVMGGLLPRQMTAAVENDIQFALFSVDSARALSEVGRSTGRVPRVQIKIETGMNRIGIRPGQPLDELLDVIAGLGNIEITGFFTHYATATLKDEPFVAVQYEEFRKALAQAEARKLPLKYIHSCNTGAVSWFTQGFDTHVRLGCIIMGYASMDDFSNPLNVEEPMSWRAFITHIHQLEAGESCGYNRHFVAEKPTTVATINIGYGDGLYRDMGQKNGPVIVNDTRTHYLATCMDQSIINVTGIPCQVGDEVTIYGASRGGEAISFAELEQITGQTCVYPMVSIGPRVKRVYVIKGGRVL